MLRSLVPMAALVASLVVPTSLWLPIAPTPPAVGAAAPAIAGLDAPPTAVVAQAAARPEFFGIVGRDPLFTLDVGQRVVAGQTPVDFLDRMAADLASLGARWVRIEFHADSTSPTGPGFIPYEKYDPFIRQIAPRHGLKVLALLNSAIVTDSDSYFWLPRLEDPPDGAGGDPTDWSNNYIRVFAERSREIAERYGDAIAAYEIFNEPNVNTHKLLLFQGIEQEIASERLGALVTNTALAIKRISPRKTIVLGGLLHGAPVEKPYRIPSDYLAEVYQSPRVQWFFTTRPLGWEQVFPWDAVALHPYDLSPENVETHVREMKARMAAVGDPYSRIWITELGMQAEPPPIRVHWLMEPTLQEQEQADYLTQVYSRLLALPDLVERVFWFKYEDFRENGLPRNWGLLRLREDGQGRYDPAIVPYPRKPAYAAYQQLANPAGLPTTARLARAAPPDGRFFPQTGQWVGSVFLHYWEANGGLARFGLPRTAAFWQGGFLVQYFERARFEHHPEYGGTPNEVQLGLLGVQIVEATGRLALRAAAESAQQEPAQQKPTPTPTQSRPSRTPTPRRTPTSTKPPASVAPMPTGPPASASPAVTATPMPTETPVPTETPTPTPTPARRYFPETGRTLVDGFKAYWEENGGVRYFGLPITDEFREVNPADGRVYTVQYFERARFEWHPEHRGTPHEIQLGLLGNQILALGNWYR